MRISPVHGDQWPVAALSAPSPPPEAAPPTAGPPAVVQAASASAESRPGGGSEHRHTRHPVFDPPLIAQRAVLGLPVGSLISDYAQAHGLPFTTVSRAVDQAMPVNRTVSSDPAAADSSAA